MVKTQRTLNSLVPGEKAIVKSVAGDDVTARRLGDMGLWPGAEVELLRRAPLGDPIAVRVAGYRLALRRTESARVCLEGEADQR